MGRSRKNKQTPSTPSPAPATTTSRAPDFVEQFFNVYANKSSGIIEPDGIMTLCSDLGLKHTDVRILMLAWKMEAKTPGYFTLTEWRKGLTELKAHTINRLRTSLVELENEVKTPPNFVQFYAYAFRYCLTEDLQRTVDIESICTLLGVVLPDYPAQVESLVEYLKMQTEYRAVNMDQWMGFYRLITEVSFPDLCDYNPMDAWPCIIDDYVDWMVAKQGSS